MTSRGWWFGLLVIEALGFEAGAAQRAAPKKLDVTVDLSRRQLEVRVGGKLTGRYPVAVGKADSRTPVGTYRLSRVIWNPSWVPPDDKWAQNERPKGPREPGNPMGRVKILFGPELYVHGTPATGTLGEPASHGCVRMSNRDATRLARLVMEYGGAHRSPAWYSKVQTDGKQSFEVEVPNPPALRIAE